MTTNRVHQLLGKYRLTDYLGKGGFAEVYLGEHQHLKSYAALKVLHVTLTRDMVDAFLLEAQTLARLVHPNIVRVLDYDIQQGTPFIIMEYVPGGTLRNHIPRGTRLPLSTVVTYVKQIASALQFAHNRNIIHRDVKPDNMLLATEQQILLSDFGLALFAPNQLSTQPGLEGTIPYSAPEQLRGKPLFASDQYSLGIVTYEWLCGVRPFEEGGPIQIANQHIFSPPPPLREIRPDLPQAVEAVVLRALAKDPQERYPDVQSFAQALEHTCLSPLEEDIEITSPRRPPLPATSPMQPPEALQRGAFARVFLSYAPADDDFARRIKADLGKQGVSFTNDYLFGPADQHDSEQMMQQAIRAAHVVLVVDSEATRSSRTVKEHLRVVASYQKRLAYVWVSGPGIAALSLHSHGSRLEVIDARQNRYRQALYDIIEYLNEDSVTAAVPSVKLQENREPRNPYKGLRSFTMDEASDFFGRGRLIDDLARKVQSLVTEQPHRVGNRLLALIGPSGSGKSSTMMAGLLPRLQLDMIPGSKQWVYLGPMRPEQRPGDALTVLLTQQFPNLTPQSIYADLGEESARGLHFFAEIMARKVRQADPRARSCVVLVIDQFEEIFSPVVSERERQHFFDLLTTAATEPGGPLLVLLTLRADFYGHSMHYPALHSLIEANHMPVTPMNLDDLRAVIEGPAALPDVQVSFEGNLAGDLLFEAQGQAGALPLLEFTLDQLFEMRQGNMLTLPAYKQIGGVKGALVKYAEAVYAQLPNEEYRALTRALFLRLIDPGPTPQDATRRRATLSELALPDEKQSTISAAIADAFVAARLLVVNEQDRERTIEVSHEALIERWPRLFTWLREARSDIILQRTINGDTHTWLRRDRPVDRLYSGSELIEAQAWAKRNYPNQDEAEFLHASTAEQERRENEERIRQQEQIRMQQAQLAMQQEQIRLRDNITNHQRRLLTILSVFTTIVIILGSLATLSYANAQQQTVRVNIEANKNASRALAANANIALANHETDLALLLSIKALQTQETFEARNALFRALMQSPHLAGILSNGYNYPDPFPLGAVSSLAFDEKGQMLYAYNGGSRIAHWNIQRQTYQEKDLPVTNPSGTIAFSPDHRTVGIVNRNGIWLIDLQTNTARPSLAPPTPGIPSTITPSSAIAFSQNGMLVAASRCHSYPPLRPDQPVPPCAESSVSIWTTQNAQPLSFAFTINKADILNLAFSPDTTKLAIATFSNILVVDTTTSEVIKDIAVNNITRSSLAFSPDGTKLVVASDDKTIHLWDTATWETLQPFSGHEGIVRSLAFSHNGKLLASASEDGTIRLWTVDTGNELGSPLTGHKDMVFSIAFSSDDKLLASGGHDGSLLLWDINAEGPINRRLADVSGAHSVLFSPDGRMLFVGTGGGKILLLNSSTGQVQTTLSDMTAYSVPQSDPPLTGIISIAVSGNGKRLAAGRADGTILLWDLNTRKVLTTPPLKYAGYPNKIMLSTDGRLLAVGGDGKAVMVWAIDKPIHASTFPVNAPSGIGAAIALSNDGKLLATSSCISLQTGCSESEVLLWHPGTGRPPTHILTKNQDPYLDMAFNTDGSTLAASSRSGISLWDMKQQRSLTTLTVTNAKNTPDLYYQTIRFSPDGKQLLSSSEFGNLTFAFALWNVRPPEPFIQPFAEGFSQNPLDTIQQGSLAFSPDSQHMVSIFTRNETNILLLWDLVPSNWQARGCDLAHRNLALDEWKQFVRGEQRPTRICPDFPPGT
ncbi:MAG TPA: protein kinase [Ktedonobacteraceae bacterium]|nr:protein kinase [Ktedonobacteraceae bacterium]